MTKQMMVIIAAVIYLIFRIFILEPNDIDITGYVIPDNKLSGIKIVFISDLNIKRRDYTKLRKISHISNELKPDIVLFGGDFVYHDLKKTMDLDNVASNLAMIKARRSNNKELKFAVLGDDDVYSKQTKTLSDTLKKANITLLNNRSNLVSVNGIPLDIAGVMDLATGNANIVQALSGTNIPRILLSHNPDIYYDVMDDVSLILAGHTHGGQFIIPYLPALFVPSRYGSKFASGKINETGNTMIISRGIGTNKFPGRLNCKPEVVYIEFSKTGRFTRDFDALRKEVLKNVRWDLRKK